MKVPSFVRCFLAGVAALILSAGAHAGDAVEVLERAQAVEVQGMDALTGHYRFEEGLMTEDSDRLLVFMSMPHGARVIINDLTLYLDDVEVVMHKYTVAELMQLQGRATQLLYATRVPRGEHRIRAEIRVTQGKVNPMKTYVFTKERSTKYLELQFAGSSVRQVEVAEW
jgi:hypothetical protein